MSSIEKLYVYIEELFKQESVNVKNDDYSKDFIKSFLEGVKRGVYKAIGISQFDYLISRYNLRVVLHEKWQGSVMYNNFMEQEENMFYKFFVKEFIGEENFKNFVKDILLLNGDIRWTENWVFLNRWKIEEFMEEFM